MFLFIYFKDYLQHCNLNSQIWSLVTRINCLDFLLLFDSQNTKKQESNVCRAFKQETISSGEL